MTDEQPRIQAPAGYRCLVIGPIGSALAPVGSAEHTVYTEAIAVLGTVIEPAAALFGISPMRADGIRRPGEIPDQLYRALRDWELVIADLTDANPNVMYELALRHQTGKCTIAISEYKRLPFDVQHIRTEQFVRTEAGLIAGRGRLVEALQAVLESGCDELSVARIFRATPESEPAVLHAGDTATDGHTLAEEQPDGHVTTVPSNGGDTEPPGFLDILAETEEAMPIMSETIIAIGDVFTRLGNLAEHGTAELNEAEAQGHNTARDRLIIVAKAAASFEAPADELETLVAAYESALRDVDRGTSFLLDRIEEQVPIDEEGPEAVEAARTYLQTLVELGETARNSVPLAEGLAKAMDVMGRGARVLRGPSSRIALSIRHYIELAEPIEVWSRRAAGLVAKTGTGQT